MGGVCSKEPLTLESSSRNKKEIRIKNNSDSNEEDYDNVNFEKHYDRNNFWSGNLLNDEILNLNKRNSDQSEGFNKTQPRYYNTLDYEFKKGECIGVGKLGSVYSGLSINTGEIVAIKSVKLNKDTSIQKQIYDINEAVEKLNGLNHKNIIKYMSTQPSEQIDQIDIIFEFCNGGSIKQLLEKFGSFDEKLIKLYVKQILEGLVYLHDQI